jgi:hypothetical protein
MGQVIFITHHIPTQDVFSYTACLHPIIPQEWLSELAIFCAYKTGGYSGLMLLFCLLASTLVVAGYFLCGLYSGNVKVAFVGAMLIWFFGETGLLR